MNNQFIQLVQKANDNNWCTQPYCTTCGSKIYRVELNKLKGELGGGLVSSLSDLDPNELTKIDNWRGSIKIAFMELPFITQIDGIIESWLSKINLNIHFTDFILFYIINNCSLDSQVRTKWITRCIDIALNEKDFSLTESLILVLGNDAPNYPALIKLGKSFSKSSKQMSRVLRNACNIDTA